MLAADLLRVWEEGFDRSTIERSLLTFALARPHESLEGLLEAGIGDRDRSLIELRIELFGPAIEAIADCPNCAQRLDIEFDLRELLLPPAENPVFRMRDLMDASSVPSAFREHLLQRAGNLSAKEIEDADPQANLQFDLNCDECGLSWVETFDIGQYLWSEIEDQAVRILREVHALASAYGWREEEILSLSPTRRALYLSMVGFE